MTGLRELRCTNYIFFVIGLTLWWSAGPSMGRPNPEGDTPVVDYSGYKVIRVHPTTNEQRDLFRIFEGSDQGITLWTEPMNIDHSMDLLVSSQAVGDFLAALNTANVSFEILIDDLQRLIDEQKAESEEHRRDLEQRRRSRRSVRRVTKTTRRVTVLPNGQQSAAFDQTNILDDENQVIELADITDHYANYSEICDWLRFVKHSYSNITEIIEIGKSYNGRPLLAIKIGESRRFSKPALWIDGGIHAREWVSPATAIFIIYTLVSGYNEDPEIRNLIKEFDWFILPVMNPDGYDFSHTTDRMWRKTRSRVSIFHRRNCIGVDANRNFDIRWRNECETNPRCRGRNPCSDVYAGSRAFSEPETIAVANFILRYKDRMKMYLSFHSYSQLWLLPWAFTKQHPVDYADLLQVSEKAVDSLKVPFNTTYSIGSPAEILYAATGGSYDWAKGVAGIKYAFTMELRDTGYHGFLLPQSEIQPTGQETWEAVKKSLSEIKKDTCWMTKTNC